MSCDLLIAQDDLLVIECIECEGLLYGKEVLSTPGVLQRLGDVVLIVVAVWVTQLREALRVAFARDDGLEDGHVGRSREVTDHLGELEMH